MSTFPVTLTEVIRDAKGPLWAALARAAWGSHPERIRAWATEITYDAEGVLDGGGLPADGVETIINGDTIAKQFLLVSRITLDVERDPSNANEDESARYIAWNLRDDALKYDLFGVNMSAIDAAGTKWRKGDPIVFDEMPLVFLPNARIRFKVKTLAGFPSGVASAITSLDTRRVSLRIYGLVVDEEIIDLLKDEVGRNWLDGVLNPRNARRGGR